VDESVVITPFVALSVVITAYDRVVVPRDTVKLHEKMPLPITSRAAEGFFPIPKNPADISPCRNGRDDTVEYTRKVFAALILYPPEGLFPRTRAFENRVFDPALLPIKIPKDALLLFPALVPIAIVFPPAFERPAFDPTAITNDPEFVVHAPSPIAIIVFPVFDQAVLDPNATKFDPVFDDPV
jgi:hypothetical protein